MLIWSTLVFYNCLSLKILNTLKLSIFDIDLVNPGEEMEFNLYVLFANFT